MTYLRICSTDKVPPGSLKSFQIKGKEILIISSNNQFFCLQGRCTHAGAPLVEGTIENEILTCPWHGSRFRITNGELVRGPATRGLQAFKYVVKDNNIYIDLE